MFPQTTPAGWWSRGPFRGKGSARLPRALGRVRVPVGPKEEKTLQ